jgi:prephenate dehydrogenase
MAMSEAAPFRRVAILGTGLIGASFGLALRSAFPKTSLIAYDKPEVLRDIEKRGFGWESAADLGGALRDADLIYLALPVVAAMELLPQIAIQCSAQALVTDAGSTKESICRVAAKEFRGPARFLGGHPIAGRELSGAEHASADLFRRARYVLIGAENDADTRVQSFLRVLRAMGAEVVWCDAETHDWAMAVVSQMPQLVALALARVIADESDETGLPVSLAGRGLRDLLRIAGSPYEMWRDICLTNTENISRSLDRVAQAIDFLRTRMASRELETEFRAANEVYKSLRNLQ